MLRLTLARIKFVSNAAAHLIVWFFWKLGHTAEVSSSPKRLGDYWRIWMDQLEFVDISWFDINLSWNGAIFVNLWIKLYFFVLFVL